MRILGHPARRLLVVLAFMVLAPAIAMAQTSPVTRYVLQVDWEAHANDRLVALAGEIRKTLAQAPAIQFADLSRAENVAADLYVEVRIVDTGDFDEARRRLETLREIAADDASLFAFDIDIVENDDGVFRLAFARNGAEAELGGLAAGAAEVIRSRLVALGIKPLIVLGDDGVIDVAIESAPSYVLTALVTRRGVVSFHRVEATVDAEDPPPLEPGTFLFEDALDQEIGFIVGDVLLGGNHLEEATARTDEMTGAEVIGFRLDAEGAAIFGEITAANVGAQIAIAIDNFVLTAPIVQEAITGGEVIITGDYSEAEARVLAAVLGNGPLPAPLILLDETTE